MRDPRSYSVSHISAPYLEEEKDIDYPTWSTTLEGSRPATGAGAVWLSSILMPLTARGHGEILNDALRAKRRFETLLQNRVDDIHFTPGSDTNILCFVVAPTGSSLRETNALTEKIVEAFHESPNFAVSRTALGLGSYHRLIDSVVGGWDGVADDEYLLVVRMVVMSPFLSDRATTERLMDEFFEELNQIIGASVGDQ